MSKTRKRSAAQVEEVAMKEREPVTGKPSRRNLLSSGSTLLNLACSDNAFGAFLKGKYYLFVGASTAGKTFLSMTCFAEASINKQFKDYRLIYDNVEDGMEMDVEGLFGSGVAKRLEPPSMKDGEPEHSFTIEEFYYNLDDALKKGKPFIYVLDSMDGLSSEQEGEKFEQHKKAYEEEKKAPGSYGDGKAKKNSEMLRKTLKGIRDSGSILIIVSQTRDNLKPGFQPKTRSGGHALRFYATVEIWASIAETLKKTVKGKDRQIGVRTKLKIEKNRITGKKREIEIEIYPDYGMDDIGSCIDYLIDEKWWGKEKQSIVAEEIKFTGTRPKLIQHIEEKGLENEVRSIVGKCWKSIDDACSLNRKKKYDVGSD